MPTKVDGNPQRQAGGCKPLITSHVIDGLEDAQSGNAVIVDRAERIQTATTRRDALQAELYANNAEISRLVARSVSLASSIEQWEGVIARETALADLERTAVVGRLDLLYAATISQHDAVVTEPGEQGRWLRGVLRRWRGNDVSRRTAIEAGRAWLAARRATA